MTTTYLGRGPGRERYWAEIKLDWRNDEAETVRHEKITRYARFTVTICAFSPTGNRMDWSGRPESLLVDSDHGWTQHDVDTLLSLTKDWHLNDMQAGCEHQIVVWEDSPYGRRPSLTETAPCPQTGYRWGSGWLVREIPQYALNEINRLMSLPVGPPMPVEG